jgi:ribosomal protein S27AE
MLSLFDIESFRRIQQILLRGMIYSDHQRDICPFCGDSLRYVEPEGDAPRYECGKCRTDLFSGICPTAGLPYSYTRIRNHKATAPSDHRTLQDPLLYQRYLEAQMHFRNITPIGEDGKIICPRCGKSHVN